MEKLEAGGSMSKKISGEISAGEQTSVHSKATSKVLRSNPDLTTG